MVRYATPAILEVDPHDCLGRRCRQCPTTVRYQRASGVAWRQERRTGAWYPHCGPDWQVAPGQYTAHQRAPWLLTASTPATGPRWRRCPACGAPA